MNKCHFLGKLSDDPRLTNRAKSNGSTVDCVNFSLMVSRKFKKRGGELGTQKCFLNFEAWDEGARIIEESFKKGDWISVYASAKTESYTNKNGDVVSSVKFRVNDFEFPFTEELESVVA